MRPIGILAAVTAAFLLAVPVFAGPVHVSAKTGEAVSAEKELKSGVRPGRNQLRFNKKERRKRARILRLDPKSRHLYTGSLRRGK